MNRDDIEQAVREELVRHHVVDVFVRGEGVVAQHAYARVPAVGEFVQYVRGGRRGRGRAVEVEHFPIGDTRGPVTVTVEGALW